ncbi:MAG: glycerophosphodiester phosphodiesterase [Ruminococcaceae bacterium]|nr:glycerophosphodiester phosphodiesterase [Oscillospiraceae bacterium]
MKYFLISLTVIALIFAIYLFILLRPSCRKINDKRLLCEYAHRGLHGNGIPENSLAAFKNAVDNGFGIELDIQLSSDGEVMVFHDYTLSRMTGDDRKLSDLTAAELMELRLDGGEEHIPTLRQVLDLVDGKVPLLIELKGESLNTSLCPAANEILKSYSGVYCVESFNPILLSWYRKNRHDVVRGLLTTNLCKDKKTTPLNLALDIMVMNVLARPDFIAYNHRYPNRFVLKMITKIWRPETFAWTVREKESYDILHIKGERTIFEGFTPDN